MTDKTVLAKAVLRDPVHLLAFGGGAGLAPKAPGTWGTMVGVVLFVWVGDWSPHWYLLMLVILFGVGVWICGASSRRLGVHDHPGIVWDEIVGYLVTMYAMPVTIVWIFVGFVLFRIFDIWKPWPIGRLDRSVSGGLGIMLDDLVAGLMAWMLLQILLYLTSTV